MSSTCPHNMMNFGLLAAEIGWPVWGTPANFNWFRVLATLLHGIYSSGCQPNFAALNRERHLYSAGRPSRWALAHISSCILLFPGDGHHCCQLKELYVLLFKMAVLSDFRYGVTLWLSKNKYTDHCWLKWERVCIPTALCCSCFIFRYRQVMR